MDDGCPPGQLPLLVIRRPIPLHRLHFTGGTARSRRIFLARRSVISLCLGTADLLLCKGLVHHECLAPSRSNRHPYFLKCLRSCWRFTRIWPLPRTRFLLPAKLPGG